MGMKGVAYIEDHLWYYVVSQFNSEHLHKNKSQSTRDYKLLGLGLEGLVNLGETP